jgi:hypothetical protein
MRRRFILLLLLLGVCPIQLVAGAERALPRDVAAFVVNAEACEHLAGEYDGDLPAERKQAIVKSIHRHCAAAQRQLLALRRKYERDSAMLDTINRHANEAVASYQ